MSQFFRLVVAPNWIGDSVMAIPFLRALRHAYPDDRLFVLARTGPAAIFRAEGSADEILLRRGFLSDAAQLRSRRFDEAWLMPNSMRAALLAWAGGARERLGYATDHRSPLLTLALPPPPRTRHQLRDYDDLLRARGVDPDPDPPRLAIPSAAAERANRALGAAGLGGDRDVVLLAPGAAFGWTKRWPPERFASLADSLTGSGFAVGLAIGPGEEALASAIAAASTSTLARLGADLDPVELAAVLARARVVIANDSGPMHLAAAVGTPVVALFGPTDPGRTAPMGAASRILDRYVFCSPCFLTECPYGHECMREVTVAMALAVVEELLG
jgi:lipopolysaccharide heptosyltransferase II